MKDFSLTSLQKKVILLFREQLTDLHISVLVIMKVIPYFKLFILSCKDQF